VEPSIFVFKKTCDAHLKAEPPLPFHLSVRRKFLDAVTFLKISLPENHLNMCVQINRFN